MVPNTAPTRDGAQLVERSPNWFSVSRVRIPAGNTTALRKLSLQNIPKVLQSLRLIKCCLLLWSARQQMLTLLGVLTSLFKTSAQLRLENLALRHQLAVLRRSAPSG